MHDILSQEEIDLLIQAATAPKMDQDVELIMDATPSQTYYFSKPNKFTKDHIRGLQRIHEQFCRTYAGLMSAKLRARLELSVSSITQLTFGDYVRSLPNPAFLSPRPRPNSSLSTFFRNSTAVKVRSIIAVW